MSRITSKKANIFLLSFLTAVLLFSCDFVDDGLDTFHEQKDEIVDQLSKPDSNGVIKNYYEDGSLMDEVAYSNGVRHGEMISYYRNGVVRSKLTYVNGNKEGKSYQYYKDGKLNMEVDYVNGQRHGLGKWYFTSGELYEETPYVNGEADGLKKRFYKDGKDKHIIPYKKGMVGMGLREYNKAGELVTDYPKIKVKTIDKRTSGHKYIIELYLDKPAKDVEFFIGELEEDRYLNEAAVKYVPTEDAVGTIELTLMPNNYVKETLHIIASAKTKRRNPLVLTKSYTVEIMPL